MSGALEHARALSIRLTAQGFGYVIFEGPRSPIDWGVKAVRAPEKNARCLEALSDLIEHYEPDVLVMEDCSEGGARRSEGVRRLYGAMESMARLESVEIYHFAKRELRQCFGRMGAATKYDVAKVICERLDAFAFRLPPPRRCWETESRWMSLFDAAALGLTFFDAIGHDI